VAAAVLAAARLGLPETVALAAVAAHMPLRPSRPMRSRPPKQLWLVLAALAALAVLAETGLTALAATRVHSGLICTHTAAVAANLVTTLLRLLAVVVVERAVKELLALPAALAASRDQEQQSL